MVSDVFVSHAPRCELKHVDTLIMFQRLQLGSAAVRSYWNSQDPPWRAPKGKQPLTQLWARWLLHPRLGDGDLHAISPDPRAILSIGLGLAWYFTGAPLSSSIRAPLLAPLFTPFGLSRKRWGKANILEPWRGVIRAMGMSPPRDPLRLRLRLLCTL